MDIKPNIKGRFGPLTPRAFNALANKVNEKAKPTTIPTGADSPTVFLAIILANTVILNDYDDIPRQWKYEWARANQANDTDFFQELPDASLTYENTQAYAYNGCEAVQQENGLVDGPGITHSHIPPGFALQPIADGTCVLMLKVPDSHGVLRFVFSVANAIDGECS